ncbi:hypothetical protein BJ878DRAFT_308617 [Calycina marina]|uniref:Protein sip5 n=1 Tax=Calycina marina TaxID=1763456 RepID=A0A9P7ZBZ2_9HELO|nr:hypothetical protein BJ878DRAFT_308617 [Calycina marina]
MGNSSSKETRGPDSPSLRRLDSAGGPITPTASGDSHGVYTGGRSGRNSGRDLTFLGISATSSNNAEVPERRETKQEREARKIEEERLIRAKERELSIKEEHVDGGFLVTMGVYTGTEDFSKPVVRQLMIERRVAPFWRGLDDFKEEWAEHQLIAAGRGLPIPAADEVPPELLRPSSPEKSASTTSNLNKLMVPISSRSQSAQSDTSTTLSASHPAFSNSSSHPASPVVHSHSPFRPRSKTLASLTTFSKNSSATDMIPREIQLANDPFVNGQALEVFLYKDATECPICFLYYPPYLNKTRCCDQPICSECFVQIKRPDPHPPEHEHNDPSNPAPPPESSIVESESLVSEPAMCPYCQQVEFGVTYDPPQFRRGLTYANPRGLGSVASAMSSSSSLASTGPSSPTGLVPQGAKQKRRTTSISANASTVITTDRVRPDWATKLEAARSHLARRSAAATALHTAAYLMGNAGTESHGFGFSSRSRFHRHRGDSPGTSGSITPLPPGSDTNIREMTEQLQAMRQAHRNTQGSSRRSRVDDLEEMMMMEAIRLSIATEEERKKKAEKQAVKDSKKKAKDEKKREKKDRKGVYGSGTSSASGSVSALSLALPGMGRRRGNSGGSNLAREITPEHSQSTSSKGKEVDRSALGQAIVETSSVPLAIGTSSSRSFSGVPSSTHLDPSGPTNISDQISSPTHPDKPSHLRQISNASSPSSSFIESAPGSLRNDGPHGSSSSLDTPNVSGTNLDVHTGGTPEGGDTSGNAGPESMFNFQSLAATIGLQDDEDKADAARHIEHLDGNEGETSKHNSQSEGGATGFETSQLALKVNKSSTTQDENSRQTTLLGPQSTTPEVMLTAVTPGLDVHGDDSSKQLGSGWAETYRGGQVTR